MHKSIIKVFIIAAFFILATGATTTVEAYSARPIRAVVTDKDGNPLPNVRVCRGVGVNVNEGEGVSLGWWCMNTGVDGSYTFGHNIPYGKDIQVSSSVIEPNASTAPAEYCSGGGFENYQCSATAGPNWGCTRKGNIVKVVQQGVTCTPNEKNLDSNLDGVLKNDGKQITVNFSCTVPATPTPTGKVLQTRSAEVNRTEWPNLQCINAQVCKTGDATCQNGVSTSERRRMVIGNAKDAAASLGLPDEQKVYIIECQAKQSVISGKTSYSVNDFACSTGNAAVDATLGLRGNTQALGVRLYDTNGKIIENGIEVSKLSQGYEWESNADSTIASVFLIGYSTATPESIQPGSVGGQQLSTLGKNAGCFITDPYGRTFDSQTLEPLPMASVELFKKDTGREFTSLSVQETSADGLFAFNVVDGFYKLVAIKEGYLFPATQVAGKAKDLFSNINGGEVFEQKGAAVHTDIALQPISLDASVSFAKSNRPKLMDHFQYISADSYIVEGRVSHPKSLVRLLSKNAPERVIGKTEADVFGNFKITVKRAFIKNNALPDMLEITKNPAYYAFYENPTKVSINPLVAGITGVMRNGQGQALTNAQVRVVTAFSSMPAYEGKTDENGYISIPAERLPHVPYTLTTVSNDGVEETVTTSQFLARNSVNSENAIAQVDPNRTVLGASDMVQRPSTTRLILMGITFPLICALVFLRFPLFGKV